MPLRHTHANETRAVFTAAFAAFAIAVLVVLPQMLWLRLLGGATIVFGVLAASAAALRDRPPTGLGVMLAQFVAAAVLVMPTAPAMGGTGGRATTIASFGVVIAGAFWASLRFSGRLTRGPIVRLPKALQAGAIFALLLSTVASIPIAIMLLSDAAGAKPMLLVYPGYFVGGLAAALIYWLLQRVDDRPWGLYLIGVGAGFCMYSAVGPAVDLFKHEPLQLGRNMLIGLACGCLVGPAVAFNLRRGAV